MTLRLVAALLVLSLSVGAAVAQGRDEHGLDDRSNQLGISGNISGPVGVRHLRLGVLAPTPTPEAHRALLVRTGALSNPYEGREYKGERLPLPPDVQSTFLAGYDAHGGNPAWRTRFVAVVQCESTWRLLAVSEAGHLGLAQFDPWTWHRVWELAGLPEQDWRSAFWQGAATSIWSNEAGPEPPGGWACW